MARGDGRILRRGGRWWIAYYRNGQEFRESAGITEREARKKLRARLAEIHSGRFVGPAQDRLTVAQLLDAYLTNREIAEVKSLKKLRSVVGRLKIQLAGWRAVDVTLPRLESLVRTLLEQGKARGTVKVWLAFLSAAFTVTRRQGLHQLRPDFPMIAVNNARRGFFSAAEFAAVHAALPGPLADVARFGYLTGWRKQEILGLTWAEVDRADRTIRLGAERSKNGRARLVPIAGELAALMERRWGARVVGAFICPFVFHRDGRRIASLEKAWRSACVEAGLAGRLFHDLRRTAIRNLIRSGTKETVAMQISGHRTRSVFDRYDITSLEDMSEALTRLPAPAHADDSRTVTPLALARR